MAMTLQVGSFEGPLDLLLYLVGREKIDIRDIFVSQVTQQYIRLIAGAEGLDMDEASEFIRMAATLLELKARSLLPRKPPTDPEEDPEELLIRQLEEYAAFKQIAGEMQTLEGATSLMHTKLPEELLLPPARIEFTGLTLHALSEAFSALLSRVRVETDADTEEVTAQRITLDEHAVPACMARILRRLRSGPLVFEAFLGESPTREEVITLFLAMLELLRLGRVSATQGRDFGEILVRPSRRQGKEKL